MTLTIHPELQALIPPLTEEEKQQLETNLLAEGCREALIIWQEEDTILDGHTRYGLCQKNNLKFKTHAISLPDLDAAKAWMLRHQFGRRNLTPEQMSYLRGKQGEYEKSVVKNPHGTNQHNTEVWRKSYAKPRTKEKLATEHHVSPKTIDNDMAYARSVDAVAQAVGPEARQTLLAREGKVGRQEVKQLAKIAKSNPQTAKHVMEDIKSARTPKAAKRIVYEAVKQTPPPSPQAKQPEKVRGHKSQLTLLAEEVQPRRGLETILSPDKREMFILHNPDSKHVFNKTNEMVDWASWTWNPVTGCWHGCDYCYARGIAHQTEMAKAYPKQFEPTFHPARLNAPANTSVPKEITRPADRNVFTCSMADLFGRWVPEDWIIQVFERVKLHPEWNFLFLTKFPQRLQEICDALDGFPANAWVGCTVDGQARVSTAERAFANIRAPVRWLSVEPMRERLTFTNLNVFDWLVIGGQTASAYNKTPAFQPEWEWVEHLWRQARKAGVKIYWKENLTIRPKEVPWTM
jgi:protein gp37